MKQILFKVHYIKREMNKISNKNMFHLIALFRTFTITILSPTLDYGELSLLKICLTIQLHC